VRATKKASGKTGGFFLEGVKYEGVAAVEQASTAATTIKN
jgi:hypothetical protein